MLPSGPSTFKIFILSKGKYLCDKHLLFNINPFYFHNKPIRKIIFLSLLFAEEKSKHSVFIISTCTSLQLMTELNLNPRSLANIQMEFMDLTSYCDTQYDHGTSGPIKINLKCQCNARIKAFQVTYQQNKTEHRNTRYTFSWFSQRHRNNGVKVTRQKRNRYSMFSGCFLDLKVVNRSMSLSETLFEQSRVFTRSEKFDFLSFISFYVEA